MKKKISYCLFEPKVLHAHRTWDEDRFDESRYWFNIPSVFIVNKILYPEYSNFFYLSEGIKGHPLFEIMEELRGEIVDYEFIEEEYNGHQPAVWRMLPLWEDVEIFMSRDIDSMPIRDEFRAFKFFEGSDFSVHTMRSHAHHFNAPCRMLIGLSSFKPNKIPETIKKSNFAKFREAYSDENRWDADQIAIIRAFTTNQFFTPDNFLDSPINQQKNNQDFECFKTTEESLGSVEVSDKQSQVFDLVEKHKICTWAGEPCNAKGEFLKDLFQFSESDKVKGVIESSETLKKFYL